MPKQIPMSEKKEWLLEYDDGKPSAEIAREKQRALKVIKRGIEEARAERDGAAARAEIVKEALIKHQQQLMGIINRLLEATEPPPADMEIRRERSGAIAPIPIPAGRILYTPSQGLTVELSDENKTLWELLKQHLTRDRIWSAIRNWKEALTNRTKATIAVETGIRMLIEIETGLRVTEGQSPDDNTGYVYSQAVKLFFTVNIRKTLGISDETNPQERMVATEDGYVRHGEVGSELAYCPGKQNECREALLRAFEKIHDMSEIKKVITTEAELKSVSGKLKRILEDIKLMGLVPGRCRICSRISL
jgi:DNA-directed RNA polymerase subunit L